MEWHSSLPPPSHQRLSFSMAPHRTPLTPPLMTSARAVFFLILLVFVFPGFPVARRRADALSVGEPLFLAEAEAALRALPRHALLERALSCVQASCVRDQRPASLPPPQPAAFAARSTRTGREFPALRPALPVTSLQKGAARVIALAAQRAKSDFIALSALFESTRGTVGAWVNRTGWLAGGAGTVCDGGGGGSSSWHGVTCAEGQVVGVDLSVNGLAGTLPAELAEMSSLRFLDLHANALSGTLPERWGGGMHVLDGLGLHENRLSGTLPASWANMSSLSQLGVYSNRISGTLPGRWGTAFSSLRALGAFDNQLSGPLPPSWGNLSGLEWLYLDTNALAGTLPPEWGGMASLVRLGLDDNLLHGTLPASWGGMSLLKRLFLYDNSLSGTLPPSWGAMAEVDVVGLDNNRLSGTIPLAWNRTLASVQELHLENNLLSGTVPASLLGSPRLVSADLSSNQFESLNFPATPALPAAQSLHLANNNLTGSVPSRFCEAATLLTLDLYGNVLAGSVPACFGRHSTLLTLDVSDNALSGLDPNFTRAAPDLSRLRVLRLRRNAITQDGLNLVPGIEASTTALQDLDLSENPLDLDINEAIHLFQSTLRHLDSLTLSDAGISGTVRRESPILVSRLVLSDNPAFEGFSDAAAGSPYELRTLQHLDVSRTGYRYPPASFGPLQSYKRASSLLSDCVTPALLRSPWLRSISVRGASASPSEGCRRRTLALLRVKQEEVRRFLDSGLSCPQWVTKASGAFIEADAAFMGYEQCYCQEGYVWNRTSLTCSVCPAQFAGMARCDPFVLRPDHCVVGDFYPANDQGLLAHDSADNLDAVMLLQCRRPGLCNALSRECVTKLFIAEPDKHSTIPIANTGVNAGAGVSGYSYKCAAGHDRESLMCSRCEPSHWRLGDSCHTCHLWMTLIIMPAVIVLGGLFARAVWRKSGPTPLSDGYRTLAIATFWLQLTHLLEVSAQAQGDTTATTTWHWLAFVRLAVESVAAFKPMRAVCFSGNSFDYVAESYAVLATPGAVGVAWAVAATLRPRHKRVRVHFCAAYMMLTLFLPVTSRAMEVFRCESQHGSPSYLLAAPYVLCADGRLPGLWSVATLVLTFFTAPVLVLVPWALSKARKDALPKKPAEHTTSSVSAQVTNSNGLARPTERLSPRGSLSCHLAERLVLSRTRDPERLWWWYPVHDLTRGMLLASLAGLVSPVSPVLPVGVFIVLSASALAQGHFRPARRGLDSALEIAVLLAGIAVYLLTVVGGTNAAQRGTTNGSPSTLAAASLIHISMLSALSVSLYTPARDRVLQAFRVHVDW